VHQLRLTGYVICDTALDLSKHTIGYHRPGSIRWYDGNDPHTLKPRWISSPWICSACKDEATANAIIAQLASLGFTAYAIPLSQLEPAEGQIHLPFAQPGYDGKTPEK